MSLSWLPWLSGKNQEFGFEIDGQSQGRHWSAKEIQRPMFQALALNLSGSNRLKLETSVLSFLWWLIFLIALLVDFFFFSVSFAYLIVYFEM